MNEAVKHLNFLHSNPSLVVNTSVLNLQKCSKTCKIKDVFFWFYIHESFFEFGRSLYELNILICIYLLV